MSPETPKYNSPQKSHVPLNINDVNIIIPDNPYDGAEESKELIPYIIQTSGSSISDFIESERNNLSSLHEMKINESMVNRGFNTSCLSATGPPGEKKVEIMNLVRPSPPR